MIQKNNTHQFALLSLVFLSVQLHSMELSTVEKRMFGNTEPLFNSQYVSQVRNGQVYFSKADERSVYFELCDAAEIKIGEAKKRIENSEDTTSSDVKEALTELDERLSELHKDAPTTRDILRCVQWSKGCSEWLKVIPPQGTYTFVLDNGDVRKVGVYGSLANFLSGYGTRVY